MRVPLPRVPTKRAFLKREYLQDSTLPQGRSWLSGLATEGSSRSLGRSLREGPPTAAGPFRWHGQLPDPIFQSPNVAQVEQALHGNAMPSTALPPHSRMPMPFAEKNSAGQSIPQLLSAVGILGNVKWRRFDGQRSCMDGEFGNVVAFKEPSAETFPKQRIDGISDQELAMIGLQRYEPCPDGYTFVKGDLGGGSFARVFLVRNSITGDLQAMKRLDRLRMCKQSRLPPQEVISMVKQEFTHMQRTSHPHMIKLHDFQQDSRYSYFIMEAVNGGSLAELVQSVRTGKKQRLSEEYVAEIIQQAAYSLHYLHQDRRIHKDVKLENLMLLNRDGAPHVVLIDFGTVENLSAGAEDDDQGPVPTGTLQTMAPEVLDSYLERRKGGFDEKCDLYSLGVVAYELLSGKPPYETMRRGGGSDGPFDYNATRTLMGNTTVEPLENFGCSAGASTLVRRLMSFKPSERSSAQDCLNDEWLVGRCEDQRAQRMRREGRHSLNGAATSPALEEAAGADLVQAEQRKICNRLLRYSRSSALQRAVAYHLAAYLPVKQLSFASDSFKRMDSDSDGVVSCQALAALMISELGVDEARANLAASTVDIHGGGFLNFQAFAAAVTPLRGKREQQLLDALLDRLETTKCRDLSFDEVHSVVEKAMRTSVPPSTLAKWLGEDSGVATDAGRLRSARISWEAFRRLFRSAPGSFGQNGVFHTSAVNVESVVMNANGSIGAPRTAAVDVASMAVRASGAVGLLNSTMWDSQRSPMVDFAVQ